MKRRRKKKREKERESVCVCVGGRWKGKTEVLTPRKFKTLGFISSTLAPPGCRDLNMHPFLHLIHLANRCPETHQPKPQIPSAYGCGPWDIGEGREEWAEAGGKQGWGDRGDERGGGDPEKTESGSLVLSGLCTKSRFGTLWVRPPPEVTLENAGIRNPISSAVHTPLWEQDSSCRRPPSHGTVVRAPGNTHVCDLCLC